MKLPVCTRTYPLLVCGFLFLAFQAAGLRAQNLIFLSFDYPYKEVQRTLYNVENLQILFEQDDAKIAARHGNVYVTYLFNKGAIYHIELNKNYNKQKMAEEAYESCMDYFLSVGAVPVEFFEDASDKRVIATKAGMVYRLFLHKNGELSYDIALSYKIVGSAPIAELEGVDLMVLGEAD